MRLYTELADWWPLLSPPGHYVEEADDLLPTLHEATDRAPATLLELGCGGGSLAHHLKNHYTMTLTDLSPAMLDVSRQINPECEHVQGDMRTLALEREFDLVLIHDAICYMTDESALRAAFRTAHRHCRPGGTVVLIPDNVVETFASTTENGGEDGEDGRGLRYLQWSFDPDPHDTTCDTWFTFLLRDSHGHVTTESDHHVFGLFPRAAWLDWLRAEGFEATARLDPWNRDLFIARKPTSITA